MNEETLLRSLAGAARAERPPAVDVADRVLARIQARRRGTDPLMWVYAAVTSAAAMLVMAWALRAMLARQDVAMDLMAPVMGALP